MESMRSLFLLGTAREGSTRVKDKMLRPFADTTLFEIYLEKMRSLYASGGFSDWGIAVPRLDARLLRIAHREGVPIIRERSRTDPSPQPRNRELYYLADRMETHVMWVNACLPMMSVNTLAGMVRAFESDPDIMEVEPVVRRKNWFYGSNGKPLNHHATSTQQTEVVHESSQAAHIFMRKHLLRTGQYFEGTPTLYVVKPEEAIDIDEEQDFEFAEWVWRRGRGR
jgi:CMP-N-acetylneuraminic acid synthetase